MGGHSHNPNRADAVASNSIDRKREQERRYMMNTAFKNSDELATRLVQRLLDKHIVETNSVDGIREAISNQLIHVSELEEHEFNFKIAPIRQLVPNPNILSLYMTQYIIEDLIDHRDIEDIFGEEGDIYVVVDSVLGSLRPKQ
jgi:antitoxin component HigA of HigAB toxin-antitoxin module